MDANALTNQCQPFENNIETRINVSLEQCTPQELSHFHVQSKPQFGNLFF